MRAFVVWIQPHPHGAIIRHISNMVISFLCSSVNYLENRLQPNDLIIVRDHENDEEDNETSRGRWRGKERSTSRWRSNPIRNSRVWL
jgi:hypothetical protein